MRIIISHPFFWPHFRRGAERYAFELGTYLSSRHHQVEILTSKPGPARITYRGPLKVNSGHQWNLPIAAWTGLTPDLTFLGKTFPRYLRGDFDLIHSLYFSDGVAARLAGKVKTNRYVLTFAGVPVRDFFRRLRFRQYLLEKALDTASVVHVFSDFAERHLREGYGRKGVVIPGSITLSQFTPRTDKDLDRPVVLCAASPRTRYKNVPLLVKAFVLFRREIPGAILKISGEITSQGARDLLGSIDPGIRKGIRLLGVGRLSHLPDLYAEAALTVLPSTNEAFGAVLIESLASGTPVVGTDSGGIPEILTDPRVGVLFRHDPGGNSPAGARNLCEAMQKALELARRPETAGICREHAGKFDWSVLGPRIEGLYGKAG